MELSKSLYRFDYSASSTNGIMQKAKWIGAVKLDFWISETV
jgi:hypothetical protein